MLKYELYNPLTDTILGFYSKESQCHIAAKGLSQYDITICVVFFGFIKRIITKHFEEVNQ